jgi:hypothetical protein
VSGAVEVVYWIGDSADCVEADCSAAPAGIFHGCYFWFCRADRRELSDILACLRRCRCGVALTCVLRRGVVAANAILDVLDHVFCLVLQLIQKPTP